MLLSLKDNPLSNAKVSIHPTESLALLCTFGFVRARFVEIRT